MKKTLLNLLTIFSLAASLTGCTLPNRSSSAPTSAGEQAATPFAPTANAPAFLLRSLQPVQAPVKVVGTPVSIEMPTLVPLNNSAAISEPSLTPIPTDNEPSIKAQALPTISIDLQDPTALNLPDTITFLLLGSDTREGASFRTDTIMIVIVRPKDGGVSIISVPRDLWVNIPQVGEQRINVAYQYGELDDYPGGGGGLLKDTILYNLGIQIDHVAMVDFNGFRKIVDTIGGIEVPVVCPYTDWRMTDPTLDPELESSWAPYTVQPGLVRMNGDLALWYARSRKMSNDFDRGRRQQEVIRALFQQGLKANLIPKIPQLYSDLSSTFTTDLGLVDLLSLAPFALKVGNANIRGYYIAGDMVTDYVTDQGAYILLPNTEAIQSMIQAAMAPSVRQQENQKIRVEVLNGTSTVGLDTLAAERLNYAGYQTTVTPFDRHDYQTSLVYDMTSSRDSQQAQALLSALGLESSALVNNPNQGSQTPYAVIIGSDYQACFDPSELNPVP